MLLALVKAPALLGSIGLTWILFTVVRRISRDDGTARWAALTYWLNPATLFGGELLGYLDALYFVPAIGALALVYFGRPLWRALFAVAIMTKPQGILIAPAWLLALWEAGGRS